MPAEPLPLPLPLPAPEASAIAACPSAVVPTGASVVTSPGPLPGAEPQPSHAIRSVQRAYIADRLDASAWQRCGASQYAVTRADLHDSHDASRYFVVTSVAIRPDFSNGVSRSFAITSDHMYV